MTLGGSTEWTSQCEIEDNSGSKWLVTLCGMPTGRCLNKCGDRAGHAFITFEII